jgi:hypothetical protein
VAPWRSVANRDFSFHLIGRKEVLGLERYLFQFRTHGSAKLLFRRCFSLLAHVFDMVYRIFRIQTFEYLISGSFAAVTCLTAYNNAFYKLPKHISPRAIWGIKGASIIQSRTSTSLTSLSLRMTIMCFWLSIGNREEKRRISQGPNDSLYWFDVWQNFASAREPR